MQEYNPEEYRDDDPYGAPETDRNKSIRGYRVVIIILTVILAALSALYFTMHARQSADMELLSVDRDSIQNSLTALMSDFDGLKTSNDTLSLQMGIERGRADSLLQQLQKERSWSLSKVRQYQKEVATLRTIMRGYIRQIDSLNTLNRRLIDENVTYRRDMATAQTRADMAEERVQELDVKVRQGSVIGARGIRVLALNARGREVSRVRNAERLRVDFTLTANALASPGARTVYARVFAPDGYVLSSAAVPTFVFEGEHLSYTAMREVDYQGDDLAVGIYYTGSGFTAGTYKVELYCDGFLIGRAEQAVR